MNALSQQYPLASHWTRSSWNGHLFRASLLKSTSSSMSRCQSRWLVFFLATPNEPFTDKLFNKSLPSLRKPSSSFLRADQRWLVIWFASDRSNSNAIDRFFSRQSPLQWYSRATRRVVRYPSRRHWRGLYLENRNFLSDLVHDRTFLSSVNQLQERERKKERNTSRDVNGERKCEMNV